MSIFTRDARSYVDRSHLVRYAIILGKKRVPRLARLSVICALHVL